MPTTGYAKAFGEDGGAIALLFLFFQVVFDVKLKVSG